MNKLKKIVKWIGIVIIPLIVLYFIIGGTQMDNARKMQRLHAELAVNAPVEKVWQIISTVEEYHQVTTPALHEVTLSGQGLEMERTCYTNQGTHWSENCLAWEDNSHFTFLVNMEAEDYPLPLTHVQGTWGVKPISDNSTKMYIDFEYKIKNPWLSWMFISSPNKQLKSGL